MERVVVTGLGLVTPTGIGTEASWRALLEGKSGVGPITAFDTKDYSCRIAAEVTNFEAADFMPRRKIKEMCRFTQFAMAATKMAFEDAGLELTEEERLRTGCFIGVGLGGLENLERVTLMLAEKGPDKVSPFHPIYHRQPGRWSGRDRIRATRPELLSHERLRFERALDRRGAGVDAPRQGRRHGVRRRRGHHYAHRHRGFFGDVRPEPPQ